MKILLYATGTPFTPPYTGGNKRFAELSTYMQKHYDADLCCGDSKELLNGSGLRQTYYMQHIESNNSILPPEAVKLIRNKNVLKSIKRSKYEKVVVFDVPPAIGLVLLHVKNIVLMVRKDLIGYELSVSEKITWRKVLKLCYMWISESLCMLRASRIITQCYYDKTRILKRHPLLKRFIEPKMRVKINNVNASWIANKKLHVQLKTENKDFKICFIGNFDDKRKGHDLLLAVARNITKKYANVEFHIIGGGKNLERYKTQFESSKIVFYGRQENPLDIMVKSDLMIVPSLADSCPNTVMEPLFWGVPVIGSNRGGIPEILEDNDSLFEINEESLENMIVSLMDYSKLTLLKEKQIKRKEELTFDWAAEMSKIILQ